MKDETYPIEYDEERYEVIHGILCERGKPHMLGQAIQEIEEDTERKRAAQAEAEKRRGETE